MCIGGVVPEVEKNICFFQNNWVINSEGIFVKIDDQWHQSRALFYDQGGIFIHKLQAGMGAENALHLVAIVTDAFLKATIFVRSVVNLPKDDP